ncbi:PLP-dependent aminotransferase family protein [Streptomyces sp. NPDC059063]|uniref:MocR-like pyridoxine biosynthesis transcription factor PdxR n=1 Tax=unclassified Streptomyces TaxID=2593676 RepID=UPI0036B028CA
MNRSNGSPFDRSITADSGSASGSVAASVPGSASDFLQLNTAEAPKGGMADWLARQIRRAVAEGLLPVGSRLPATRVLAAELGVSRGVVTEAYRRLTEDGHVAGRGRGGTVVVAVPLRRPTGLGARSIGTGSTGTGSTGTGSTGMGSPDGASPGRALFSDPDATDVFDALRAAPARIDLSPGLPDLAAFPRAAWLRAERSVLADLVPSDFGYGDPRGTPALRRAVARWLARNRGIAADPDEVLIVAGTAQALGLLATLLHAEGVADVAIEDPSSLGLRQHLHNSGLRTPPVRVDARGIRVDELRATGAPAVLLTPAHQFPTGVVLDGVRRRELADWTRDGGLIIEDDYDAEHRYDRPPVPALRSTLADHVCYAGSVSKLLAPALRVGWLLAPRRHLGALADAKRFADLGNAALPQLVLAHLMESGELERHLRFLRKRHRVRRDTMIEAIAAHLPGAVVHGAAAGLHLMVTFEDGTVGDDMALATAALEHGVKVQPLSWHTQRPYGPGLVLGYAASTPTDIAEGVGILGGLVR